MIGKIMGIESKSEGVKGEKEIQEDLKGKEVSCSICLEVVAFGGDRSTARLQCGHEFHLDCIGSAFNAKGSMQCPNCRKIEEGNWLYANKPSRNPLPDLNMMEEWTHDEDLYDLSYSEMPLGVHWCPFGRLPPQFASFFEEGESSPPLTFQELFNQQAVFPGQVALSSTTTGHPCPYITYLNPLQPSSSSSPSPLQSLLSHHHNHNHNHNHPHHHPMDRTVLGQPLQQIPPPHPPSMEFQYHSWNPFQYNGIRRSGGNGGGAESDGQARGRGGQLFDFLGNSSRSRNPTSLVPPLMPQFMRIEPGMPDPSASNMFQWPTNNAGPTPPSIPSENTTPFCLFPPSSSNTSNVPTEDAGGNRFYAWERDRFAPYPLMPVENGETGWWGQSSESEQRRVFWQQPRNRSDGSSYRGPRMQSFM
ncbi:hypothetical protein LUZ60_011466 [Juncus effusus]|nr:hypothetical protein LUZ60_011466 [Juncus effusus]